MAFKTAQTSFDEDEAWTSSYTPNGTRNEDDRSSIDVANFLPTYENTVQESQENGSGMHVSAGCGILAVSCPYGTGVSNGVIHTYTPSTLYSKDDSLFGLKPWGVYATGTNLAFTGTDNLGIEGVGVNTAEKWIIGAAASDRLGTKKTEIVDNRIITLSRYGGTGNTGAIEIIELFTRDLTSNRIVQNLPFSMVNDDTTNMAAGDGVIAVANSAQKKFFIYNYFGQRTTEVIQSSNDTTLDNSGNTPSLGTAMAIHQGMIFISDANADVNGVTDSGCVYVFDINGLFLWTLTPHGKNGAAASVVPYPDTLSSNTGTANDNFGKQIAVGDGRIAVTANSGIHIFDIQGNPIKVITTSDVGISGTVGSDFGQGLCIGGGRIYVGIPSMNVGGFSGADTGMVEVYDLDGNNYNTPMYNGYTVLVPGQRFGFSIAEHNGFVIIGSDSSTLADQEVTVFRTGTNNYTLDMITKF